MQLTNGTFAAITFAQMARIGEWQTFGMDHTDYFVMRLRRTLSEALDTRMERLKAQATKLMAQPNVQRTMEHNNLQSPEDFVNLAARCDITNGSQVPWVMNMVAKGQIRLPEDEERVKRALTIFERIKRTAQYTGPKDLNQVKTFRELEAVANRYEDAMTKRQGTAAVKTAKAEGRLPSGVSVVYEDEKFKVVKYELSPQEQQRALDARQHRYGGGGSGRAAYAPSSAGLALSRLCKEGTPSGKRIQWCVSSPETGDLDYLSGGPLFLIYKDGEPYILATHNWDQIMNIDDIPLAKAPGKYADYKDKAGRYRGPSPALQFLMSKLFHVPGISTEGKKNMLAFFPKDSPFRPGGDQPVGGSSPMSPGP